MTSNDTVVITGVSGRIAAANNVEELERYLYDGVDLIGEDDRWPKDFFGLSNKMGVMSDFSKFDAEFFGISDQEADLIDPQIRVLIEVIFECICDAGQNRERIKGSRTGIYYAGFYNEIDRNLKPENIEYLNLRQTFLGWLCYAFDVTGPCYMYETACSSSCSAIVEAFNALKHGLIDYAIIATSNTIYSPSYGLEFQDLGLVSKDGKCRFLDANASGYVKSDAATAFLLQRKSSAKRIYARILNAVSGADGYKKEGVTFPKWIAQRNTIKEAYEKVGINPLDVNYVEAHGTGTQVGDAQEINAIYEAFKVKDRKKPLLLGSVKTNVGHSEGSSGLTSLLKVIFTFKNKCIPQSLHFNSPNTNIEPLMKGEIAPVVSNTPFDGEIIGVNSFGFGGSNVHLIVASFDKDSKKDNEILESDLSRLVSFCGRTEERVNETLEVIKTLHSTNQLTEEYLSLINDYSKQSLDTGLKSRGFLVLNDENNVSSTATVTENRPLYFVFGGLGQQLKAMAAPFMRFNVFAKSIKKSVEIVDPLLNINLLDILTNENCEIDINESIISLIPIAAFQVAMIDLFVDLGIQPDGYVGHSFGEFACGYLEGALTQEQYLLSAVAVYKSTSLKGLSNGVMAATDLSREEFESRKPKDVYLACDNSEQSITVAGAPESVSEFIAELEKENRFARMVRTGGIAFHCPVVDLFLDSVKKEFSQIMPNTHTMSSKWISTVEHFDAKLVTEEAIATYFTRCITNRVNFRDAITRIPKNAVIVEISARKFMAPILTRSLPSTVSVLNIHNESGVDSSKIADRLLALFGSIYEFGFNVEIEKLYPPVSHPFDCTTRFLSPLIKLNHSKPRLVRKYPEFFNSNSSNEYTVDLNNKKWSFLEDHKINGEIEMPFSMYAYLIWDFVSKEFNYDFNQIGLSFENMVLHQKLILTKSKPMKLHLAFLEGNGRLKFSVKENANLIITAIVRIIDSIDYTFEKCELSDCPKNTDEIYTNLAEKGYDFGHCFKQIVNISNDFRTANVKWTQNVVTFLESVFHLKLLENQNGSMIAINQIESLQIDAKQFIENGFIHIHYDPLTKEIFACTQSGQASLLIRNITYEKAKASLVKRRMPQISVENDSIVNKVCVNNNQSNCSIIGVSGTSNSKKFVGLVYNDHTKKELKLEPLLTWNIPEGLSHSESAAIVLPFYTAYYSLLIRGQLKSNENVMILNGYTPIGIASIAICLNFGCRVFTTVENSDERIALVNLFAQLNKNDIYLSKNDDFEEKSLRSTNGNGFDLILSSTFDDSIQNKLQLVALNGRFLQILSPETNMNAILGLQIFLKNIVVHGIQISSLFTTKDYECEAKLKVKKQLHQLVEEGIKSGVVRELPRNGTEGYNFDKILNANDFFMQTTS